MGVEGDFNVTVTAQEVVAPALPIQDHWLPLSNLDLLLPPVDVSVFFCYDKGQNWSFKHQVSVLKKALAQALVSYYAFVGEVVKSEAGEPELLCNNRGVVVVEAVAPVELRHLNLYDPDQSVEGKLVPKKVVGVLTVQATELKCGAMVVACTFDHRIADAYSANMFFVTWANLATASATAISPCFPRSLLQPRCPVSYAASLDSLYIPISHLPPPPSDEPALLSRIYHLPAARLSLLQSLARHPDRPSPSRLQTFSAFLWKLLSEHACKNKRNPDEVCKMGIVVDGRTRLSANESAKTEAALASYFGNVLSIPYGREKCVEMKNRPLNWVANQVYDFLETIVTKEHFLDLIDWVEAHRPEPTLAQIYATCADDGPAFVVSSGQRFPVSKLDFGWGKPVFGSYHFPWGGSAGYVMPMPCPNGNRDWIVYMHLEKGQIDFIEAEASDVFRPFSLDLISPQ